MANCFTLHVLKKRPCCETVTLLGRRRLLNDLDRDERYSQPYSREEGSVFQENVSKPKADLADHPSWWCGGVGPIYICLLYTSPSPRDA